MTSYSLYKGQLMSLILTTQSRAVGESLAPSPESSHKLRVRVESSPKISSRVPSQVSSPKVRVRVAWAESSLT